MSHLERKLHNPKSHAPAVYIPCWLAQVPILDISLQAKMVYGRLSQWSSAGGICTRSAPELAKELGLSARSVERYIHELKEIGLIGTYQQEDGGKNCFEFYDHEWMHLPLHKFFDAYEESYQQRKIQNALPPDRVGGTPPTGLAVPPPTGLAVLNKNINKIKTNRATSEPVDNSIPAKKPKSSSSDCSKKPFKKLKPIPENFEPTKTGYQMLWKTADRVKMPVGELLNKFINVSVKYKTKSGDWQKKFIEFLEREIPKKTFEDKTGKLRRHDGGQLHY